MRIYVAHHDLLRTALIKDGQLQRIHSCAVLRASGELDIILCGSVDDYELMVESGEVPGGLFDVSKPVEPFRCEFCEERVPPELCGGFDERTLNPICEDCGEAAGEEEE